MKYKVKNYFMMKEIAGDYVVLARGHSAIEFNGVLVLNESCALLWKHLQEYITVEELADIIRSEYSIGIEMALTDVKRCISKMIEYELVDFKE